VEGSDLTPEGNSGNERGKGIECMSTARSAHRFMEKDPPCLATEELGNDSDALFYEAEMKSISVRYPERLRMIEDLFEISAMFIHRKELWMWYTIT
jgi:hypothetical protein